MTFRRRNEFSSAIKREIWNRSGGLCEIGRVPRMPNVGCGARLGGGNTFYEHIICDNFDVRPGELTADDGCALCKTCWRIKTDEHDLPVIAHVRRMGDRSKGIKTATFRPLPGTRASGIKMPMKPRSRPIDRSTGQPWGSR